MSSRLPPPRWLERQVWELDSECRKMPLHVAERLFFPTYETKKNVREAKEICARCPVMAQCRELGLTLPTTWPGVFGGLSRWDRVEIRYPDHVALRRFRERMGELPETDWDSLPEPQEAS